jgi:DNA modification methylase
MSTTWKILVGDCREVLSSLPERSVQTVVTSPPYF